MSAIASWNCQHLPGDVTSCLRHQRCLALHAISTSRFDAPVAFLCLTSRPLSCDERMLRRCQGFTTLVDVQKWIPFQLPAWPQQTNFWKNSNCMPQHMRIRSSSEHAQTRSSTQSSHKVNKTYASLTTHRDHQTAVDEIRSKQKSKYKIKPNHQRRRGHKPSCQVKARQRRSTAFQLISSRMCRRMNSRSSIFIRTSTTRYSLIHRAPPADHRPRLVLFQAVNASLFQLRRITMRPYQIV